MSELVMVIEDEKEIRDLLRYNLERSGFRVAAFADGEEGLEQLFASRPDAVVLDLMLPGRSGFDVCRAIRADPQLAATRVLMLTARGGTHDAERGMQAGADDYMTKPFSTKELVARVRGLVEGAAAR